VNPENTRFLDASNPAFGGTIMKTKTQLTSPGFTYNHNQTLVRKAS
jgi:hypothetical protein